MLWIIWAVCRPLITVSISYWLTPNPQVKFVLNPWGGLSPADTNVHIVLDYLGSTNKIFLKFLRRVLARGQHSPNHIGLLVIHENVCFESLGQIVTCGLLSPNQIGFLMTHKATLVWMTKGGEWSPTGNGSHLILDYSRSTKERLFWFSKEDYRPRATVPSS